MQTLKLKYKCIDEGYYDILHQYMSQYSICLHYLYNRFDDSKGELLEKELRSLSVNINNIDLLDSWFVESAVKESIGLYKSFQTRIKEHEDTKEQKLKDIDFKYSIKKLTDHEYAIKKKSILRPLKLVFGGKENQHRRQKLFISKEQFKERRLNPLSSIGEALFYGNRKFLMNSDLTILFKPSLKQHFNLKLNFGPNQERILKKLYELTITKSISISYKLSKEYICISYDETKVNE